MNAQEMMQRLTKASDDLTKSYKIDTPQGDKQRITRAKKSIKKTLYEIIRADLHSRTGQVATLTALFGKSTKELKDLKASIESATKAVTLAASVITTLTKVLAII